MPSVQTLGPNQGKPKPVVVSFSSHGWYLLATSVSVMSPLSQESELRQGFGGPCPTQGISPRPWPHAFLVYFLILKGKHKVQRLGEPEGQLGCGHWTIPSSSAGHLPAPPPGPVSSQGLPPPRPTPSWASLPQRQAGRMHAHQCLSSPFAKGVLFREGLP